MSIVDSGIDLVDQSGQIVKQGVPKAHSRAFPGLYAQVVIVVLFDARGRLLVHTRLHSKEVNPGDIDFVCGMVEAGETPLQAALRESVEATGLRPSDLKLIHTGINAYGRYRFLFTGSVSGEPSPQTNHEVEWVRFLTLPEIEDQGPVVDEFFDDLARVNRLRNAR